MKKLAILGSGDLGQLIAHHAPDSNFEVVGFFDDFAVKEVNQIPILGKVKDVETQFNKGLFTHIIIGIGYKHLTFRSDLFKSLKNKIPFANIVHSSCYIDSSVKLGEGIVILPGSVVDKGCIINDNVLLNTACVIAHDSEIGFNCFLAPRVSIAGFVVIGESCFIGINTTVIDGIQVANNVQTGGATLLTKDIIKCGLYVGVPARFVKEI